jgi:P27 family predicted phage terminase small subunit
VGSRGPVPRRRIQFRQRHPDQAAAAPEKGSKRLPEPPDELTRHATALWGRLVPRLVELEMVEDIDATALAVLCECYATWNEARQALADEGPTYEAPESKLRKRNPAAAVASQAGKDLLALLTQFGLTPAARARLGIVLEDAGDDQDDPFFSGRMLG